MKYLKISGLVALATAATMAFAGNASATVVTSPAGTAYTGAIKAESVNPQLHIHYGLSELDICESELEWKVESHGASATAVGPVTSFALFECDWEVTLLKPGQFEVHTTSKEADGYGDVTWTGVEITVELWGSFDCIYKLENPYMARVEGSKTQKGNTATFAFEAWWGQAGGSPFCPKKTQWTSYFLISSPDYLDVD